MRRHIGSPEAAWRVFQFKLQDRSHAVYLLAVHLPNQQELIFRDVEDLRAVSARSSCAAAPHLQARASCLAMRW